MAEHNPHLRIAKDGREAARQCAAFITEQLTGAITRNGKATLAISGGNTPKPMFEDLAKAGLDWSRIDVFWVDERCVPPDNDQSNYKMAKAALLEPAHVPDGKVHRILGELDPDEAAKRYIQEIQDCFQGRSGELPSFDVLHRGMGPDAHTASLFPGEPLIQNTDKIAAHVWVEKLKMHRVTLLPGVLRKARCTVLQVTGADKAEPLHSVLHGPIDALQYPCQIGVRDGAGAVWFLDEPAAAKL